jgi:hypothetical protein
LTQIVAFKVGKFRGCCQRGTTRFSNERRAKAKLYHLKLDFFSVQLGVPTCPCRCLLFRCVSKINVSHQSYTAIAPVRSLLQRKRNSNLDLCLLGFLDEQSPSKSLFLPLNMQAFILKPCPHAVAPSCSNSSRGSARYSMVNIIFGTLEPFPQPKKLESPCPRRVPNFSFF